MKHVVVELLQSNEDLDDFGRDMVKTLCEAEGVMKVVYVQHPLDNLMITVGYTFNI